MNKKLIGIIIGVLLFGGLVWLAAPNGGGLAAPAQEPASALTGFGVVKAEETSFDFGAISMAAGKVRHSFSIRNTGDEAVTIGKMYTSCMCTVAELITESGRFGPYGMPGHGALRPVGATLAPGEEATVETTFDPAAHGPAGIGRIQRAIIMENSAGEPLELGFTADVTP